MLIFALGHEQLPAAYGVAARPALRTVEAELSPEAFAAARDAAAQANLADLIERALAAVSVASPTGAAASQGSEQQKPPVSRRSSEAL